MRELEARKILSEETKNRLETKKYTVYEAVINNILDDQFRAVLAEELIVKYENNRFEIEFMNNRNDKVSCGRKSRSVEIDHLTDATILADESSVEIFVNEGAYVFSTRYYPEEPGVSIEAEGAEISLYKIPG